MENAVMNTTEDSNKTILEKVQDILESRKQDYGDHRSMFLTIATYWGIYIAQQMTADQPFRMTARDVAIMMILQKIAREGYQPKEDNITDIIGYSVLLDDLTKFERTYESK